MHSVADDEMEVVSRSLDDTKWIVAYVMDDGPVRYYRYHRDRQESEFLFTNREDLEGLTLAKMHPVVINTRDELDMVCYYTLPVASSGDGGSQPDRPLPMVLEVHGGPWARDCWGYEPTHQWLANRGYAVLSVNFRGSTGLGKGFANAGNLEWGRKMHDDLIDAVRWAVDEGIADPERIAISGGSYGGYATLVGLTLTPDIFACGVDLVGPSEPGHDGRVESPVLEAAARVGSDPHRGLPDHGRPRPARRALSAGLCGPNQETAAHRPRRERSARKASRV